ncbi:MAG: fibronectin type III [Monoraphidium minutum]|nr:MAG: fibronectin type III [Monoraphidium minutum]
MTAARAPARGGGGAAAARRLLPLAALLIAALWAQQAAAAPPSVCTLAMTFNSGSSTTNMKLNSNSAYVSSPFTVAGDTCVTVSSGTFSGTTGGYNVLVGVYSSPFVADQNPATNLIARGGSAASASAARTFTFNAPAGSWYLVFTDGVNGVAFTAPASDGGAAITGYTATSSPGGKTGTCAQSPCTVTGLTNGVDYTFTVTAANNAGTGAPSAANDPAVTPARVPDPPTNVTAVAGDDNATVAWTAPADTGGSAITGYTASPGSVTKSCPESPCTVTGLTNGVPYTFTVAAINSIGTSIPSTPSAPVTPTAGGGGQGDPQFTGFDGTKFFFNGLPDKAFANALFGSIGPSCGAYSNIWMTGFGVLYRGGQLSLEARLDTDPAKLRLYQDIASKDGGTVRVAMPEGDRFLHIMLNGRHLDAIHLTLDLGVKLLAGADDMHGVLGQTLAWAVKGDGPSHVVGGVPADRDEAAYMVEGGLMGHAFKYSLYDPREAATDAPERQA